MDTKTQSWVMIKSCDEHERTQPTVLHSGLYFKTVKAVAWLQMSTLPNITCFHPATLKEKNFATPLVCGECSMYLLLYLSQAPGSKYATSWHWTLTSSPLFHYVWQCTSSPQTWYTIQVSFLSIAYDFESRETRKMEFDVRFILYFFRANNCQFMSCHSGRFQTWLPLFLLPKLCV